MPVSRRAVLGSTLATAALPLARARGQAAKVTIGVLNDQSGAYRDLSGPVSVACARQAIEEFGGEHGFTVDLVSADHQNKPDIATSIAREWFDKGVDLLIDVPTSSVGLAVQSVAREKNKVYINTGAATSALTGPQCSPNFVHWAYDTYMLSKSTGGAMVRAGGDTWFFITADYAFGHQLQSDTTAMIQGAGGKVLGSVLYPFPDTTDFSSFLVQAQAATLLMFISDVHALGLDVAKDLVLSESFYWDLNDRTRAFTKRVLPKIKGSCPGMDQAGVYSGSLHYLKTAAAMGAAAAKADGRATVARMKAMEVDDDCFGKTRIREDGRHLVDAYLFQVKQPSESKGPWDYYKLLATTPADQAFRPLADGHCPFVKA